MGANSTSKAIVDRWLPRLGDKSVDVQEKSIDRLAQAATDDPSCRDEVLPALMRIAEAPDEPWANRIPSAVLQRTIDIPKMDKEWLIPFLEFYLRLAKSKQVMEEEALGLIAGLMKEGRLRPSDQAIPMVVTFVRNRLTQNDDSESRGAMFLIDDWYIDNVGQ
jgi:hypothetical protein